MFGKILFVVVTTISAIAYCLAKTPSTTTTSSESTVCVLQPKDSTYVAKVGTRFEYTAEIHGSVGRNFYVEYEEGAFSHDYSVKYDNPQAVKAGMCGGDSGKKTLTLTALKKGKHTVKIIHDFRGKTEKEITCQIRIK